MAPTPPSQPPRIPRRPVPKFPIRSPGLWRRTPPAIFPPILGLLGLGIAWRRGADEFGLPAGVVEMYLGAVSLVFLFAVVAYLAKVLRRPAVLAEELRILPGRAGLGAGIICVYAFAGVVARYAPEVARGVLFAGLALHAVVGVVLIRVLATGPAPQRRVTPVWHLNFAGMIVAGVIGEALGMLLLARVLFVLAVPVALVVWAISIEQFREERVAGPLRPLLAIHMTPANFLGFVALGLGWTGLAHGFAAITALLALTYAGGARWMTESGFSPLWGAMTFPMASATTFWLTMGGGWRLPGDLLLIATTLFVPPVAFLLLRMWARGELAAKTNAATA